MERALLSLAAEKRRGLSSSEEDQAQQNAEWDTLAAPEWPSISSQAMMLSPSRCRALWRQFSADTNFQIQQVMD